LTSTNTPTLTSTPSLTPTITLTFTPRPLLTIKPLIAGSYNFALNRGDIEEFDEEIVEPYGIRFFPGEVVQISMSQTKYSFDHMRVYPPNEVVESKFSYIAKEIIREQPGTVRNPGTIVYFTASMDPKTIVKINVTGSQSGSNAGIEVIYR
jgi:hypothetical protein